MTHISIADALRLRIRRWLFPVKSKGPIDLRYHHPVNGHIRKAADLIYEAEKHFKTANHGIDKKLFAEAITELRANIDSLESTVIG